MALDGVDLPEVRRDTLALLHQDVHAASVGNGPASLLRTWSHFHNTWFAGVVPVFPLTVDSIEAVGALFKKGRFRAVASYVSAAKDRHIELEYPWSAHLSRAVRRTVRSVLRGRGAAALDVPGLAALRLPFDPEAPRHPLGLRAALATRIMFCMREIEFSHLKVKHVKFDMSLQTVTLYLPSSKTDCAGTGRSRSWGCLCGAAGGAVLCPFRILSAHFHDLRQRFAPMPQDMPVFPSAAGTVILKPDMVREISYVASLLGQDLLDTAGAQRFTGHSLRVTGARWLAELGLPLVSIQLLARWEGETIRRCVTEAPLTRLAQDYRIAAGDLHLRSLLAKSETELASVRSQLTAVPDGLWDELASFRARSEQIVRYLQLSPGSTGVREAIRDDLRFEAPRFVRLKRLALTSWTLTLQTRWRVRPRLRRSRYSLRPRCSSQTAPPRRNAPYIICVVIPDPLAKTQL